MTTLAEVLEPELPAIADAIVRAIGAEVPEYARPLEGAFGEGVRLGVTQALERFVAFERDPDAPAATSSRVYVALGRNELRAGRTLDALQSAYRIGARVAWRHIADVTAGAGFGHDVVTRLAEDIFAYIDELSAESVEGYAQAQSQLAGERERRRGELVDGLLRGADVTDTATALGWTLPRTAAALACPPDRAAGIARRIGPDAVPALVAGTGCVIVPDANAPGRAAAVRAAAGERAAALGPELELARFADSWRLAAATLAAHDGFQVADEHLAELLLHEGTTVVERITRRRLSALAGLTPKARERTAATALAYVQHHGNAAAMARALGIHPQTARYRITGLRELLGDQLDDPDGRFELEAALRAQRP